MTPYPLSKSDTSTKVLITLFMLTMLAAFSVAELNVYDKMGRLKGGVVRRYGPDATAADTPRPVGTDSATSDTELAGASGEVENLPFEDEASAARVNSFTALLDATHPHVFELPVVMLVLAHFLMRTRAARWVKLSNYVGSFGGIIVFLSAPWLVRYASVKTAPLLYVGAASIGLSALTMIAICITDLWVPQPARVTVATQPQTIVVEQV